MKVVHRGHEIDVRRERCMAGYSLLYFSIFRQSDRFECTSGHQDSGETVRDLVKQLRERVDAELAEADPWMEREGVVGFAEAYP